ncbi:hypothetical protein AAMO2058_000425400 [Amorphochlora amoebiformis]
MASALGGFAMGLVVGGLAAWGVYCTHNKGNTKFEGNSEKKRQIKGEIVVVVGSTNPCKADACKRAFERVYPDKKIIVVPVKATSGVSDQPMCDEETLKGATRRAEHAAEVYQKSNQLAPAHFSVGLEGGLNESYWKTLECHAWMCVRDLQTKKNSLARTASFSIPKKVEELIRNEGKELGEADDIVFKRKESKKGQGTVGILTNDLIPRAKYYEHAIILALVPFINPHLY